MKRVFSIAILLACGLVLSAQDSWVRKPNIPAGRNGGAAFSVGNKGYLGTGSVDYGSLIFKDFWEYDPLKEAWSQKADFPGQARSYGVGFTVGDKGYMGLGRGFNDSYKDLWEYDATANSWTKKADFPGSSPVSAATFTLGNKAYVGTGVTGIFGTFTKEFWEYDPAVDSWTRKADFPGLPRSGAVGFTIGAAGYMGTGGAPDVWYYTPNNNRWTRTTDFPGGGRQNASGFSNGFKGYIGLGGVNDLWEYNPQFRSWTKKADFPGIVRQFATSFNIGTQGYISCGFNLTPYSPGYMSDHWLYNTATITTGALSSSYCMDNPLGIPISVSYNFTGQSNQNPQYTVQISDANGDFTKATTIGTGGGAYQGVINAVIPSTIPSGDHYRVRVIATTPFCIGQDNGADIQINSFPMYRDADGDGFGDINQSILYVCPVPAGYVRNNTDCDDTNENIHEPVEYFIDADQDGYGSSAKGFACSLTAPAGFSAIDGDFNDNDPTINTLATFKIYFPDEDGDGFGYDLNKDPALLYCYSWIFNPFSGNISLETTNSRDCLMERPTKVPTTYWFSTPPPGYVANGDDCNDLDASVFPSIFYADTDGDGYGDVTNQIVICSSNEPPAGYVSNSTDCDVEDAGKWNSVLIYIDEDGDGYHGGSIPFCYVLPLPTELPAGYSYTTSGPDCDDTDADVDPFRTWYEDKDNDGYGNNAVTIKSCSKPVGYVNNNTDCDDNNLVINPATIWYQDTDGDGYSSGNTLTQCSAPAGYRALSELISALPDCDDGNALINPGSSEICKNGLDDNCDGRVDDKGCEGCPVATSISASLVGANSVQLSWVSDLSADLWEVSYKPDIKRAKWVMVDVAGGDRSVNITGLLPNTSYIWQVRAKCGRSWAGYSITGSFTTLQNGALITRQAGSDRIEETSAPGFALYPNPTRGSFMLSLTVSSKGTEQAVVHIRDMAGRIVYSEKLAVMNGQLQRNMRMPANAAGGLYITEVVIGGKIFHSKLLFLK